MRIAPSTQPVPFLLCFAAAGAGGLACGDDDNGGGYRTEADLFRVGGACRADADCPQPEDGSFVQECLTEFTGGYCGLSDCTTNEDCPGGSACVRHDNRQTYCFRQCVDKAECNANRSADVASNCSSNIEFTDSRTTSKACVPPSSG